MHLLVELLFLFLLLVPHLPTEHSQDPSQRSQDTPALQVEGVGQEREAGGEGVSVVQQGGEEQGRQKSHVETGPPAGVGKAGGKKRSRLSTHSPKGSV